MSKPSPQVSREADNLETMLDALPPYGFQRTKVWDAWENGGMPAALGLLARYKQVPDNVIDQAIERLRVAATERAKTDGDQAIAGYIDKMAQAIGPSSGSVGGSLADNEKPMMQKQARRSGLDSLMDGVSQHLQKTGGL